MSDDFEYISHARLEYQGGYRHAYLGEVAEPVINGVQGAAHRDAHIVGMSSGGPGEASRTVVEWTVRSRPGCYGQASVTRPGL